MEIVAEHKYFNVNSNGILNREPPGVGVSTYPDRSYLILEEEFPFLKPFFFDLCVY